MWSVGRLWVVNGAVEDMSVGRWSVEDLSVGRRAFFGA